MNRARHHASHRGLIEMSASNGDTAPVDAIIVPSARRVAALEEAGRLAELLGCALLVLCSKHSEAEETAAFLARRPGIDAMAIDFPEAGVDRLPILETSEILDRSRLSPRTDTSAKRNLGLILARLSGWRRVAFLDDDILVPNAIDLGRAAALLDTHDAVGLQVDGFPDNSVVCHANRETGAVQSTFIGGGALVVPADRIDSFFPVIYNCDWFFLLDETTLRRVGQVGVALQRPYDPFADPARAHGEEFGDVLAEGLFTLFDDGGRIADADREYWSVFRAARRELIAGIRTRIETRREQPTTRDRRILAALGAADHCLQRISPETCVAFMRAWQRDRERWRRFVNGLRPIRSSSAGRGPIDIAADRLGLRAFRSDESGAVPAFAGDHTAVATGDHNEAD